MYHSGDTAYFDGFKEIGRRLKPDVALLPIGAYFPDSYRAVHTSPEEAVRGFVETGAGLMVPMHFGTFRLGREPMEEPVERLRRRLCGWGSRDRVRVLEEGETMRLGQGPDGAEDGRDAAFCLDEGASYGHGYFNDYECECGGERDVCDWAAI